MTQAGRKFGRRKISRAEAGLLAAQVLDRACRAARADRLRREQADQPPMPFASAAAPCRPAQVHAPALWRTHAEQMIVAAALLASAIGALVHAWH